MTAIAEPLVSAGKRGKSAAAPDIERTGREENGSAVPTPGQTLFRLACFFALIAILIVGAHVVITTGLWRISTSTYGAWNQMMQGHVNADVVITGSSRAAYHYDPRVITATTGRTAFNLGRNGSQTDVQLAVLRAYLEHNRKPKLIIHNLDAFTFVSTREVFEPAQYVPYLYDPALYSSMRQISPEFAKSRYLPLYGYVAQDMNFAWVLGLRAWLGSMPREDSSNGFTPRDAEWGDDFRNYQLMNPKGVEFAVEPKGMASLEQLIQLCRQYDVPLVLVYSPEYSEMQALENNRAKIFGEFQRLASQYNVPLWDYSGWKLSGDTRYFYNSQHLNARGAAIFSADISGRLNDYLNHAKDR